MNLVETNQQIAKIKKTDPQYKVFGSAQHNYEFKNPISKDRVNEILNPYSMDDLDMLYAKFITELGNGGAGFGYGILPIEKRQFIESKKETVDYIPVSNYGGGLELIYLLNQGQFIFKDFSGDYTEDPLKSYKFSELYMEWLSELEKDIQSAYEFIDLRFQGLKYIPSWVTDKIQVKKLYLNGNNLENIDKDILRHLVELEVLLLNDNNIDDLSWIIHLPKSLKQICVRNNRILDIQIEKEIKNHYPNLEIIF